MFLLPLRTRLIANEWRVMPVPMATAQSLVSRYHYTGNGSSAVVYAHGLMLNGDMNCWGVAWWIPAPKLSVDKFNPKGYKTTLVLHRLVVHPLVPTNGASFLLGGSIRAIKQDGRYELLLTYADTAQGHTGQIYKATNWEYAGLGEFTAVWVNKQGVQISAYQHGRILSHAELRAQGYGLRGYYSKHIYKMRLPVKQPVKQAEKQMPLWEAV